MSIKEEVLEELEKLDDAELREIATYLAFLKHRSQRKVHALDESQLAALYSEFAIEDRELAEQGLADYAEGLIKEDAG